MSAFTDRRRTTAYKPLLAWFCLGALVWTILLLFAGGVTTSIRAGMAFLDWPLSDGSINPEGWLTQADRRAEHSHRLLGATVGLLTLAIAAWVFLTEGRAWVRRVALAAVGLVVFQGVLGGARVLFDQLNTGADHNLVAQTFAVIHACLAQVFLCVLVVLAVALTRRWIERDGGLQGPPSPALRNAGILACATLFIQLVLGALMRHSDAGLAIPTFPLTPEGGIVPVEWDFRVAVHFAHRAWAVAVLFALAVFAGRLRAARHLGRVLGAGAIAITGLLAAQVLLGALVIWTFRNPHAATMHMLTGAVLLATCWAVTFLAHRPFFKDPAAKPCPGEIAAVSAEARPA
jgi:cytochrome c oxidase assembly protein subunit 15